MLYRNKTRETPHPDNPNWVRVEILPDLEPLPCTFCGTESVPNICEADGRYHHHGQVHLYGGALRALCREHGTAAFQRAQIALARQINATDADA